MEFARIFEQADTRVDHGDKNTPSLVPPVSVSHNGNPPVIADRVNMLHQTAHIQGTSLWVPVAHLEFAR